MPPEININDLYEIFAIPSNKQNQYQIRRMHETDIPIVVVIEQITWSSEAWPSEDFIEVFNDPFHDCWILESTTIDNSILGYGFQQPSNGNSHIVNLCIHPNQRGRGLGGILLRHMIDYARQTNASLIDLEVDTSNKHAYTLYINHGFRIYRFLERYYSNNADAYRMTLKL